MDVWSGPVPLPVDMTSTDARAGRGVRHGRLPTAVGVTAVIASILYITSDVIEVRQGFTGAWSGWCLMVGVVLVAAGVRDLAFAGMGAAVLVRRPERR